MAKYAILSNITAIYQMANYTNFRFIEVTLTKAILEIHTYFLHFVKDANT